MGKGRLSGGAPNARSARTRRPSDPNAPGPTVEVTAAVGQPVAGGWVEKGDTFEVPERVAEALSRGNLVSLGANPEDAIKATEEAYYREYDAEVLPDPTGEGQTGLAGADRLDSAHKGYHEAERPSGVMFRDSEAEARADYERLQQDSGSSSSYERKDRKAESTPAKSKSTKDKG